ncbi:MAG: TetR/AcrR family transcriptional regulator C-terminal domain-containing protein [Eubacteriales bacterium]
MTNEELSLNTKKSLASALKKSMEKKRLSKITVSELTAACNINRNTFYYHFEDIYALLKWVLEQETIEVIKNFDLLANPTEAISFVIDYADANKHILNCAYDSIGREEMKHFFYDDLYGVVESIIDGAAIEIDVMVEKKYKDIMSSFYTEALAGMLINYFQDRKHYNRDELVDYMYLILRSTIPKALYAKI